MSLHVLALQLKPSLLARPESANASVLRTLPFGFNLGDEEIRSRNNLARSAFSRLKSCLWSKREISLRIKSMVYHLSCALNFTLRLRDMACTSSRRRMLEVFENDRIRCIAQRLCAIRGTASSPLTYKHAGTARAKKAPQVSTCS